MADQTVVIEDDATVTVELPGDEVEVAETETGKVAATETETEIEPEPRQTQQPRTRTKVASDEAAEALTKALETAEAARVAAEQTAEAERRRAAEATRIAQQSATEVKTLREESENKDLAIIEREIESRNREVEAAAAEMKAAFDDGDFTKAAAAQVKVSKAAAALDRAEAKKADYEANPRKPATTEGRVVNEPVAPSLFEQYVSQPGFTPKAQAWLRAHPDCIPSEYGGDAEKNSAMMEAHFAAKRQKIALDSPEYYRLLEEKISGKQAATDKETEVETPPARERQQPAQRRAQPSAPVTRNPPDGNGNPTNGGPRRITLNAQQQEVALFSYPANPGENEAAHRKRAFGVYATELARAQQEGKIGRMTH